MDVAIRDNKRALFSVVPGYNANSQIDVAYARYDPHTTVACQLASPREEHPTPRNASLRRPTGNTTLPEGEPCITQKYRDFFDWRRAFATAPPRPPDGRPPGVRAAGGLTLRGRRGALSTPEK